MFIALELKKDEREEPDALQKYNLTKIVEARGLSFVVCPENWLIHSKILTKLAQDSNLKGEVKDGH